MQRGVKSNACNIRLLLVERHCVVTGEQEEHTQMLIKFYNLFHRHLGTLAKVLMVLWYTQ